ncbi:hypothetical protein TKK_0010057 [Trichogramma kaykai]|uniref:Phosphoacetylglucosamine mutase n=1 Tax=Trichogramma kaykai TaxID=54128 RepID=A0ABD2WYA1_9HYME
MQAGVVNSYDFKLVEELAKSKHPKCYDGFIQYGTAGFRMKANILDHVVFRMGLLTALRSQFKKATIGLMITASHNPEEDNGVKLVDPSGEMLESSWEKIATQLANVEDVEVCDTLRQIIKEKNIDTNFSASVIIGRDTRNSSYALSQAAINGAKAMNGTIQNLEIVTTPQLHFLVVCTNTNGVYGNPSIDGYYEKISTAFHTVAKNIECNNSLYTPKIQFDAANGVGGIAIQEFKKRLNGILEIDIYNNGNGQLNYMCGADFVKVQQKPPNNVPLNPGMRCVSVDGDADRVIYYYTDEKNDFHILDGDKIATLIAGYFKELLLESNLTLQLGLVQTAYANGASTEYISEILKVPVACVSTGVKHLHHKALDFDIGVYFEANGHGTVVFQKTAIEKIQSTAKETNIPRSQQKAAQKLNYLINVINQTVGDAISDMLLIELILRSKKWDIIAWEKSYIDLPNKQVKITVKDRSNIVTTDAERKCVKPEGLQDQIDKIVEKYKKGRSFVRPSGTEDVVRVYAECDSSCNVENLAAEVSLAVYELAGGVGDKPTKPQ